MRYLERITLCYVRAEDRLCLRGSTSSGRVIWLWLTYRLARQLVRCLLDWALRISENTSNTLEGADKKALSEKGEVVEPVSSSVCGHEEVLTHSVSVSFGDEHILLRFQDDSSAEVARLGLSYADVSTLLEGFRACFADARWHGDWRELSGYMVKKNEGEVTIH